MLLKIQDKTLEVFIKGNYLKKDKKAVAIVGTRQPSKKGKEIAYKFAYDLAKKDITIISGLALGIDTAAHTGALDAGGRTIAILGHGLNMIYPRENYNLANRISKSGCLITKFKEGTIPLGKNFLARNQLIAGLSQAVVVIEADTRSGSISTANWAADFGIEVFAVPGSPGTDMLIENGASIAIKAEDILDYLNSI